MATPSTRAEERIGLGGRTTYVVDGDRATQEKKATRVISLDAANPALLLVTHW